MSGIIEPAPLTRPVAPSLLLRRKIEAVRRKQLKVRLATGASVLVVAAMSLLAAEMTLDWWLELPRSVRGLLLAVDAVVLGFILVRFLARPFFDRPDDDTIALMVERAIPDFSGRLISSVQLTEPDAIPEGASTELVHALIEETEALSAPIAFNLVIKTDKLVRWAIVAGSVLALAFAAYSYAGKTGRDLLRRTFLSNIGVPRKTRVVNVTGSKTIGRGDNVTLEATAQGIIPRSGKVFLKYASGRAQSFPLEPDKKNRARFSRVIENVPDSFAYFIRLNDGTSDEYQMVAVPRPTVTSVDAQQVFPAYTRLGTVRRAMGDLSLLAGSRLLLHATTSKNIQSASLRVVGLGQNLPMQINPQNPRELGVELGIPTNKLSGFSIHLVDDQGVESKDSAVYRIDIVTDRPPTVRVLYPERKEELITQQATLIVSFEAIDDFSIGKVSIHYKSEAIDAGAEKVIELDLGGQTPKSFRRRYEWKIGQFQPPLAEGNAIEYWVAVHDTNDATGPGVGTSEHFLAKVVSESEKRADLLNRVGDALGIIGDVAQDQEKLNQNLGALILERTR